MNSALSMSSEILRHAGFVFVGLSDTAWLQQVAIDAEADDGEEPLEFDPEDEQASYADELAAGCGDAQLEAELASQQRMIAATHGRASYGG